MHRSIIKSNNLRETFKNQQTYLRSKNFYLNPYQERNYRRTVSQVVEKLIILKSL